MTMRARIFQVDAFTDRLFAGNPAAVVLLPHFPEDPVLQAIAAENNLAETAFLVPANTVCAGLPRPSKFRFVVTPPWQAQR